MARRLLAATLLGLLTLSGCGGSPSEEPTTTASASPTKTTPATPEPPEVAKANTKEGAVAFVQHYVELVNLAQSSGEVRPLVAASAVDCVSCATFAKTAKDIYGDGGHIEGGDWTVKGVVFSDVNPAIDGFTVALDIVWGPQKVVRGTPPETQELKGGGAPMNFQLAQQEGAWRVMKVTRAR